MNTVLNLFKEVKMITGKQHLKDMLLEIIENYDHPHTLEVAYVLYTGFYTLTDEEVNAIDEELVRANLVYSIDLYLPEQQIIKLKDMLAVTALEYLERFQ